MSYFVERKDFTRRSRCVLITKNAEEEHLTIYERMLNESRRLEEKIQSITKQLSAFPSGKLYCTHTGKYVKWHVTDGKHQEYIPKKNRKFAEQLAQKKYLLLLKEDLENEKRAIDFYLRHHKKDVGKAEKLLTEELAYQELLQSKFQPLSKELSEWQKQEFESNPYYPEKLIHRTASGRLVRSKSEAIIDMFLSLNNIPFHYEEKLVLGGITLFPDFTIRHPQTGETFYWEHFGRMDDPEYIRKTASKIQRYSLHGIIPGIKLITTYETEDAPLSTEMVEKIIEYYFL